MLETDTFWALVGLILFIGVVIYFKVPGIVASFLDKRAIGIKNELDEARRLREEAQALLAEYQRKAREAEQEAEDIVQQAKREAAAYATEAMQRTDEYVTRRAKIAEQKIAQAESVALHEVRTLSAELAVSAAERILKAKVAGADAEKLVADAIGEVRTRLH